MAGRGRTALARALLRLAGWRVVGEMPRRGVLIGAPHTSNWDLVVAVLVLWRAGAPTRILVKQEAFVGPLGRLLHALGAIPVDRRDPGAVVRRLTAEVAVGHDVLLALAPEGTRGRAEHWKSGFYRIAERAGLPVVLGFIDGPTRTTGVGPSFLPSGDVVADMDRVRAFYADKHGLHPEHRTEPRLREERRGQDPARPRPA